MDNSYIGKPIKLALVQTEYSLHPWIYESEERVLPPKWIRMSEFVEVTFIPRPQEVWVPEAHKALDEEEKEAYNRLNDKLSEIKDKRAHKVGAWLNGVDLGPSIKVLKGPIGCPSKGYYATNKTPTYRSWMNMNQRCNNPNNSRYSQYGGRGIKICKRWKDFTNFLVDMGERPQGKSLERENNDGDYCKENCRWATNSDQNYNKGLQGNNTSGVKGVHWNSERQKWVATWYANGRVIPLGRFISFEKAVAARKQAEVQYGI